MVTCLPVLMAGGGFRHQGHVAFDRDSNKNEPGRPRCEAMANSLFPAIFGEPFNTDLAFC